MCKASGWQRPWIHNAHRGEGIHMFNRLYPDLDWNAMRHEWPHSSHSHFVRVKQMRWHVQRMGQGPVALLLHGTGASTHTWREVMPLLAQHHTTVAVDLPGHAFSSPLPQAASMAHMASALIELLQHLQLTPELWVGHSAGAAIAVRALTDPQWQAAPSSRLVALNPAWTPMPGSARWIWPLAAWVVGHNPLSGWLAAKQAQHTRLVEQLLKQTGSRLDVTGVRLYRYLINQPKHNQGVLAMMSDWNIQDAQARLPLMKWPVQLQIGLNDKSVPPSLADAGLQLLPHAKRVDLPGLGHLAHEEDAQGCVRHICSPDGWPT
jgi:magnesium chelatase accessory protein